MPFMIPRGVFTTACVVLFLNSSLLSAEVTLDGSMGPAVALGGPDYAIDASLGTQVGDNLFHSFGAFNIFTGESATFNGPASIANVINRVTGGGSSTIDGTISSSMPVADFYMINPAGFVFGPNASLNVGGSFHVSTADYLRLGADGRFDATNPSDTVLTISPPSAFGFLDDTPGPISTSGSFMVLFSGEPLSLTGGDVNISAGSALASIDGEASITSVRSAGEVPVDTGSWDAGGFAAMGDVTISEGSQFSAQGLSGGSVIIRAGKLTVNNASDIDAHSFGGGTPATTAIDIVVRDSVLINGDSFVGADANSDGNAGDVYVETGTLQVDNGSLLGSRSLGGGAAGTTKLNVDRLTLANGANIIGSSFGAGSGETLLSRHPNPSWWKASLDRFSDSADSSASRWESVTVVRYHYQRL